MSERLTLLPCPFCGSSAEGDTGFFPLTNLLYVWCSNAECGCSPKGRGERMFLPEEWNRRAALSSLSEGWVMVPKKPTPEMLAAMNSAGCDYHALNGNRTNGLDAQREVYAAALHAARHS